MDLGCTVLSEMKPLAASDGKEYVCNAGDLGSMPWSGRSLGEGPLAFSGPLLIPLLSACCVRSPPAASGRRLRMDDTSPGCLLPSLHKVLYKLGIPWALPKALQATCPDHPAVSSWGPMGEGAASLAPWGQKPGLWHLCLLSGFPLKRHQRGAGTCPESHGELAESEMWCS